MLLKFTTSLLIIKCIYEIFLYNNLKEMWIKQKKNWK